MADIKFSKEEIDVICQKIQGYFEAELRQDIGRFDAEFLLDFFAQQVGPYFYNRGLRDARAVLAAQLDDIGDAIYALEQSTAFKK
jgi:uncharacterized protein (DUF2164 family)